MAAEIAEVIMKTEITVCFKQINFPFCDVGLLTQVYSYTEQPEFALNQAAFEVNEHEII